MVITGGGTGIGKAVAIAFAEAGASVSIPGRRIDALRDAEVDISTKVLSLSVDLVDKDDTVAAFKTIEQRCGKIDILVCNAGAYPESGSMSTYTAENLMRSFEHNVVTTLHAVQAFSHWLARMRLYSILHRIWLARLLRRGGLARVVTRLGRLQL